MTDRERVRLVRGIIYDLRGVAGEARRTEEDAKPHKAPYARGLYTAFDIAIGKLESAVGQKPTLPITPMVEVVNVPLAGAVLDALMP